MEATATTAALGDLDSPAEVLAFARERRAIADRAEAELLQAAVVWADQHPAESLEAAEVFRTRTWLGFGDTPIPLAGPGTPLVAEFSVAEFAAAVGMTTEAGKYYLGHALELRHRLPKLWKRVVTGDLPVWKARRVADLTAGHDLTPEAAAHVDRHVAPVAHKIRPAALDRLVAEAIARHMPATAEATRRAAADGRHVEVDHQQVSFAGSRRGVSSRTPRSAAKVEERRPRPERSEGLGDASRNPVRCLAPTTPTVATLPGSR
jgi:hypothetical protein